ncbi:MAG TPA: RNA polymerase sigma factor [Bacteroidales bacterium]|nr:MAG: RNA polymerase subunit sigma-24 [Bacteroidetes bacterium GWF2_35_48]OFY97992.1 MAG: RNA polymerase subunit sigma-24 [Bacteroidetes bacterium RIFOXYC12_FULL_35_7]HBX50005.1 RNA polymerase sigma factor [Bacteroidales bacterium]
MTAKEYNICVDRFSDRVYRFVLKSVKDKDKAHDIIQDSYEKMWINHENIDFEKSRSYLFSTAYHTMIDLFRKEKKKADFNSVKPDDFSHSEQYSDLNEILHRALNNLPEDQKSVILLRDYEGYSYEEIGEITGLNESQVKVYIYRARLYLKQYIGHMETVL